MREYEYRAWHDGVMYAVYSIQFNVNGVSRVDMINHQQRAQYHAGVSDDCILMEYTGVKDCNGTKIYESDIVRIEHTALLVPAGTIGVVTYACGRYIIETHTHTHGLNVFVDRRFRRYAKPYIEVIGNLWETPQLAPKK